MAQTFLSNKASTSGGGAVYWDSPDVAHAPIMEPIHGAGQFYHSHTNGTIDENSYNTALYGVNFASAGSKLVGRSLYIANNTVPFSPVVRRIDHYGQTVVNKDRSQSVTVFAQSIDKLFGKSDFHVKHLRHCELSFIGNGCRTRGKNCSFVSSSSRIADYFITIAIHECLPGELPRNQDAEARVDYTNYLTGLSDTMTANMDLRFDEEVPHVLLQGVASMVTNDADGR